jgi:hypothetical protein
MATVQVILQEDSENTSVELGRWEYRVDIGEQHFARIEQAVEGFKNQAARDVAVTLLAQAQRTYTAGHAELTRNGTTPVAIKSQHGELAFRLQRYVDAAGAGTDYFERTGQFQGGYLSAGLGERVAYYSNRMSYAEVAGLVERWTGQAVVSDQTIRQVVIDTAVAVSAAWAQEVQVAGAAAEGRLPAINPTVDVYAPDTPEVLLLADDIQVKGQKEHRERRLAAVNSPIAAPTERATIELALVQCRNGQFEYLSAGLDAHGQEQVSLAEMLRSRLSREYGTATSPLEVVALTDGASKLRTCVHQVCGPDVTIILDWYHLSHKVEDLMSMIARTKDEKTTHVDYLLSQLWHGHADAAQAYLTTMVQARNEVKRQELVTYLKKHQREIIDYARRQQAGKRIGSGQMEKACDQVIGHRQKKKGMSWRKLGSCSLGILKVMELNHQWQELWFPTAVSA